MQIKIIVTGDEENVKKLQHLLNEFRKLSPDVEIDAGLDMSNEQIQRLAEWIIDETDLDWNCAMAMPDEVRASLIRTLTQFLEADMISNGVPKDSASRRKLLNRTIHALCACAVHGHLSEKSNEWITDWIIEHITVHCMLDLPDWDFVNEKEK